MAIPSEQITCGGRSTTGNSYKRSSSSDVAALDQNAIECSTERSSSIVSILNVLKSPTVADIAYKRKTNTNAPPVGKRKHKGQSPSDLKGIEPNKRAKVFPREKLTVSGGKLFSSACHKEIGLKRSTIKNHVHCKYM